MTGHNIFVSYRYDDRSVGPSEQIRYASSTLDYLDYLRRKIDRTEGYYYRGERSNNDLSHLSEEEINRELNDKMFSTSITIVLLSPDMKKYGMLERDQWIPREIRYSLREKNRSFGNSHMNAVIAVVLPDKFGNYDYLIGYNPSYGNYHVKEEKLFSILRNNMNNRIDPEPNYYFDYPSQTGTDSYIPVQTWDYFIKHFTQSMELILDIRSDWRNYEIFKKFDCDC